jgi:hypothetical protein
VVSGIGIGAGAIALLLTCAGCAHRYSEDPKDWVGPAERNFDPDFAECRQVMDEVPFRFRGDPRLIFLDCMEKHDWHLKGRS